MNRVLLLEVSDLASFVSDQVAEVMIKQVSLTSLQQLCCIPVSFIVQIS